MISLLSIRFNFLQKGDDGKGGGGVPVASTELYIWKTGILPGSPD